MGGKSKSGGGTTWSTGGKSAKKPQSKSSKPNPHKSSAGAAGSKPVPAAAAAALAPATASPDLSAPGTANGSRARTGTGGSSNGHVDRAVPPATAPLPATGIELIGKVVVFKHDPLSRGNPRIHPPPKPTLNPRKYLLFDSPTHFANYTRDPASPSLSDHDTVLVITSDLLLHLAVGRDVTYYVWDDFGFMHHERKHRIQSTRECVIQNYDLLFVGKRDVELVMSLYDAKHVLTQVAGMVCVPGGVLYEKGRRARAFAGLVGRVVKLRPEYMVLAQSIDKPTGSPALVRDPAKTLLLPTSTTYQAARAGARPDELVVHLTESYIASCATLVLASVLPDRTTIPPPVVIGSMVQFSIPAPRGSGMDANEHGAVVELEDRQSVLDLVAFAEHLRAKASRARAHADGVGSRPRVSLLTESQEGFDQAEQGGDEGGRAVPLAAD